MKNNIMHLLRENGPLFPAEVSAKVGGNSFLAKAYLMELVSDGAVKAEKFGLKEGMIYFLPGQETLAEQKVNEILSIKRTPSMYSENKGQNLNPEVAEKQRKFSQLTEETLRKDAELERLKAQRLKEFEARKATAIRQSREMPKEKPVQITRPIEKRPEIRKIEEAPRRLSFEDRAMDFIQKKGMTIVEELDSKKGELNFVLEIPTPVGNMHFLCKVRNKKKINDTDLSLVHSLASSRNMHALFITGGNLSKAAQDFVEKTKSLKVIRL